MLSVLVNFVEFPGLNSCTFHVSSSIFFFYINVSSSIYFHPPLMPFDSDNWLYLLLTCTCGRYMIRNLRRWFIRGEAKNSFVYGGAPIAQQVSFFFGGNDAFCCMFLFLFFCNCIISLLMLHDEAHLDYAAFVRCSLLNLFSTNPAQLHYWWTFCFWSDGVQWIFWALLATRSTRWLYLCVRRDG